MIGAFVGAIFGALVAAALVWTYVTLVVAPKLSGLYDQWHGNATPSAMSGPIAVRMPPAEIDAVRRMLDADQKLKVAALDYGEGKSGVAMDEYLDRLRIAALDFTHALPDENKTRIREAPAFNVEPT